MVTGELQRQHLLLCQYRYRGDQPVEEAHFADNLASALRAQYPKAVLHPPDDAHLADDDPVDAFLKISVLADDLTGTEPAIKLLDDVLLNTFFVLKGQAHDVVVTFEAAGIPRIACRTSAAALSTRSNWPTPTKVRCVRSRDRSIAMKKLIRSCR